MGTRSITEVRAKWYDEEEFETLAVIYRHFDGYLSGHGEDLADFLEGAYIVNGSRSDDPPKAFNGAGRLAAALIVDMEKNGVKPALLPSVCDCGQEYHYRLDVVEGRDSKEAIHVTVFNGPMTAFGMGGEECTNQIFSGSVHEYISFILATP